jgi:hypothetical protein
MSLMSKIADIDGEIQELVHESKLPALNKLLDESSGLYLERIAELEKKLLMLEQYNGSVESLIKEIGAHNLEQRAKGCDDGAKACSISFGGDAVVIGETELNDYANDLRAQADALKEQVK